MTDGEISELYRSRRGLLLVTAYRILGDWQLAEDACQEAFITMWIKFQGGIVIAYPRSWIYRTLVNRATDILRARGRLKAGEASHPAPHLFYRVRRAGEEPGQTATLRLANSAEAEAVAEESTQELQAHVAAVVQTQPSWQGIIEAKVAGLLDREIAALHGITRQVVKARLKRLRFRLHQRIAEFDPIYLIEATA